MELFCYITVVRQPANTTVTCLLPELGAISPMRNRRKILQKSVQLGEKIADKHIAKYNLDPELPDVPYYQCSSNLPKV